MRGNSYGTCYENRVVQDITPRYETITKEVITGYNNSIIVDEKKIYKESSEPLQYLRVKRTYSIY